MQKKNKQLQNLEIAEKKDKKTSPMDRKSAPLILQRGFHWH